MADQMFVRRDDIESYESADALNNSNTITAATAIVMIALVFFFSMVTFIGFIRRRISRVAPTSREWKILDDPKPSQKRYVPSDRLNDSFSINFSSDNTVSYPDKAYTRNAKISFESDPCLNDGDCLSDSYSESYSLRNFSIHSTNSPKLSDEPPSLGDVPKFRTESDTWEKYLIMVNNPEKLNEAVEYMRRTGHSPHNSKG